MQRILLLFFAPLALPLAAALPYVIEITDPGGGDDLFVTATLPLGASASAPSHSGRVDAVNGLIKWGPLDPSVVRAVSFFLEGGAGDMTVVTAPAGATSTSTLSVAADGDGDGMADDYELANGLVVGIDDSAGDADQDGFSNRDEFLLQTAANDAGDLLATSLGSGPDVAGLVRLRLPIRFASVPLRVESSATLGGGVWQGVPYRRIADGQEVVLELDGPFTGDRQFFRVRPRD
jgi:hypothetical protein